MPKVSIVIPTYNRAQYIVETIQSALSQTFHNFEIIIVDDGSSDDTKNVINKLDGPIKYFFQENRGVSAATNFGIMQAKGEYIAFLDSDDIWLNDHLYKTITALEKSPSCKVAFSGFDFFGDEGDSRNQRDLFSKSTRIVINSCFKQIKDNTYVSNERLFSVLLKQGFPFRLPGSIVERRFISNFKLSFNERITYAQEGVFYKECAAYTNFVYIEQPTLLIRKHKENYFDLKYNKRMNSNKIQILKHFVIFLFRKELTLKKRVQLFQKIINDFLTVFSCFTLNYYAKG